MGCHSTSTAGVLLGTSIIAAGGLLGLLGCIRLVEKKERRAIEKRAQEAEATEEKTIVVENRGEVAGQEGVNEIVTTGPEGTTVEQVQTGEDGTAIVSTAGQGVDGEVTVGEGEAVVVTAEQPVGEPDQAEIVRTATTTAAAPTI